VGENGRFIAAIERLGVEVRALRRDLDHLRDEVRAENAELRAQIAVFMSHQQQQIQDAKKKQPTRRSWPSPLPCLWSYPTTAAG
jgi:hypothetical protein